MNVLKKYIFIILVILFVKSINVISEKDEKSSLTFVIDDTGSMWNDIQQVKMGVNDIFEAVLNSKDSQIENYILITFNDPDVRRPIITKEREVFKKALNDISVDGGLDCPEYSISGIEKALEVSLPGSYLYVCTDATAKDYDRYKYAKALAQKKGSQVVFLLTGNCGISESSIEYKVYYDLSKATNGQVFHLGKTDIHDLLNYVRETVKGRRTPLATADFPSGTHKLNFTADHKTTDVIISVAGQNPKVDLTDPDGAKAPLALIVDKEKIGIYGKNVSKPGVHTVTIESVSKTSVLVTGRTKFNFKHGFSTFVPVSVDDGATRPPSGLKSRLSIQLIEGDGVELKMIKFKNSDDKDIGEKIPFSVVDEKRQFYLTDLIDTPKEIFKISILCYDTASDSYLLRATPTMIEASTILDLPKPKSPKVIIDGEPKIVAEYDEPLKLKCKIHAYPQPSAVWQVKETEAVINSTISVKELPYEYISIAEIEKVNKNETYRCIVANEYGKSEKEILVETINKYYFTVLQKPEDITIDYEKSREIICNVDAYPSAAVIWFKDGIEVMHDLVDENIEVSEDNKTLKIKNMQPSLSGNYMCEARNTMERKLFHFKVIISGIESPKLNKTINRVYAVKGSTVNLSCTAIAGKPKPAISWYLINKLHQPKKFYREVISIKNVDVNNAGIYKCIANNLKGIDFHATELIVEYPATIKNSTKNIIAREGEKVTLKCDVDGVPKPIVRWFRDGAIITSSRRIHIYRDHTLKFKASLENAGRYTCTAQNKYASVNETTMVDVYVPVTIESPKESILKLKVGSNIVLPCRADGYPRPSIQWLFYNKIDKSSKVMKSKDSSLHLSRLQLENQGYYVCSASNAAGSANITYDVQVLAPPVIENVLPDKRLEAVTGDLALLIPCKVIGSPKPSITWLKDGLTLASGSEWYNIESDGSLIIKNVDLSSAGAYVCEAKNYLGSDRELYEINVIPYPRSGPPTNTIIVENGGSTLLNCDIPHTFLDLLRWYKDGKLIARGEFELNNITLVDSGIYSCRVSDFVKSRTGHTRVIVGMKPMFLTNVEEEVPFEKDSFATLDCDAFAEPPAKVTWFYNEMPLNDTDMLYKTIKMRYSKIGTYTCEVYNEFGKIKRNFRITLSDCILNIRKDFAGNQPLMYNSPLSWANFDTSEGFMIIPKDEYISLFCPTNFQNFPKSYITAFCQGDSNFKVNGKPNYKYTDLKCTDNIKLLPRKTGKPCNSGKGELIKVGYLAFGTFLEAYQVCFDKYSNLAVYTKNVMKHNLAGVAPLNATWQRNDIMSLNIEFSYDCDRQIDYISKNIGKRFPSKDKCCFTKRQLVNPKDMVSGLAQMATYSRLNVIPHWSSCSTKNWQAIENRVRFLAKTISYDLEVYTGVSNTLQIQQSDNKTWAAHITDEYDKKQAIPQYLWKVIQDPVTRSSLAIIQVNAPDLVESEANKYIICRDICDSISWMRNRNWKDVTIGYTYCCTLQSFIKSFHINSVFDESFSGILYDVASIADHSLTLFT